MSFNKQHELCVGAMRMLQRYLHLLYYYNVDILHPNKFLPPSSLMKIVTE